MGAVLALFLSVFASLPQPAYAEVDTETRYFAFRQDNVYSAGGTVAVIYHSIYEAKVGFMNYWFYKNYADAVGTLDLYFATKIYKVDPNMTATELTSGYTYLTYTPYSADWIELTSYWTAPETALDAWDALRIILYVSTNNATWTNIMTGYTGIPLTGLRTQWNTEPLLSTTLQASTWKFVFIIQWWWDGATQGEFDFFTCDAAGLGSPFSDDSRIENIQLQQNIQTEENFITGLFAGSAVFGAIGLILALIAKRRD